MRRSASRLAFSTAVAAALCSFAVAPAAAAPPTPVTCGGQINAPGQYLLVGDCTGAGIGINSSDVHLRLMGHTMQGDGVSNGISMGGGVSRVRVQGPGTVSGYRYGAYLGPAHDSRIERVTATNNEIVGFWVVGGASGNQLIQVNGSNNRDYGVEISAGARDTRVIGGTFNGNSSVGIWLHDTTGNEIVANEAGANPIFGIWLLDATGNRLHGNTTRGNGVFDLTDFSPDCDDNDWEGNHFNTSNQSCID